MAQKTSINIKPCNIGSSEAHNKRTAEYLAHINKERLYVRTDLMASNEVWVAPELGNSSLTDRYNQIAQMVKEKTGRKMQTKDRERMNKKTGKVFSFPLVMFFTAACIARLNVDRCLLCHRG